jgi:Zn-finger in Ran binding protein and others
MAIREGAWDCPSCDLKGIPGSRKYCGACGTPRGSEVEFYLPEGAREVTAEEEKRRAKAGPDWKCPYCGGDNPSFNSHCSGCGSSQDGAEKRATKVTLDKLPEPPKAPAAKGPNWMSRIFTGCILLVLLFVAGCWMLTRTSIETMQVQTMSWQRSIDVETLGMVTEEGWQGRGEVPSNAHVLSRQRQVREHRRIQTGTVSKTRTVTERVQTGTQQVKVGTKDMGNGYFEDVYEDQPVYEDKQRQESYDEPVYREEPVYDTRVRYEVEKWHKESVATSRGDDNAPQWPNVEQGPRKRPGARSESYEITLSGDGESYTYEPETEAEFVTYSPGQTVQASVTVTGTVTEVQPE